MMEIKKMLEVVESVCVKNRKVGEFVYGEFYENFNEFLKNSSALYNVPQKELDEHIARYESLLEENDIEQSEAFVFISRQNSDDDEFVKLYDDFGIYDVIQLFDCNKAEENEIYNELDNLQMERGI